MKIRDKNFNPEALNAIWSIAKSSIITATQLRNSDRPISYDAETIAKKIYLAEAITPILESATIFHNGGGYRQNFCSNLEQRIDSFKTPFENYFAVVKPEFKKHFEYHSLGNILDKIKSHYVIYSTRGLGNSDPDYHKAIVLLEMLEEQLLGVVQIGELNHRIQRCNSVIEQIYG